MALGDITQTITGQSYAVELLASAIAANGAPTAAAGIEINALAGLGPVPKSIRVGVRSTAGSGTMTVACRLWQRSAGFWFVSKALAASDTAPQTAGTIAETGNDTIGWCEPVDLVSGADRLYLEIVAIAGTSTAVTGYAIVGR